MASRSRCLTCRLNRGVELRKSVAQEPGLLSLEQSPQWHGCCFGQGAEEAQASPLQKQLRGGGLEVARWTVAASPNQDAAEDPRVAVAEDLA